ncbi:transcriptional regulator [Leptolyngbya sp. Heron Island J]|uniref:LuxR C-terminal-related transcriptional regulator n=1 Tax=Leptolyngbya sp. Heron Island J TaxID=1385935 RepID=UPI0003B95122|nr:LuxR C-terminal-related transcriptional regulator [Leptolyngbya sp. Heron Island J]ESA35844.1 transcriptional regulator [Leptolyngbya sp. Heron Island J]
MYRPILTTKLYIPPPRPNAVVRSYLIKRLNTGLHCKLTLISAPAGFGKTTLLSEWAAVCKQPVSWLSLDEEHNDPTRFLVYLVSALQTLTLSKVEGAPQLGEEVLSALKSPQPPPITSILTTLINEITTVSKYFILVLDDYHLIDSKPVDQALEFLVQHLPPSMHLFIATRKDPPLPLARLRARGQVTELRALDLRFSQVETAEFLNKMDLNLSVEEITALKNRTEGWIAGLQLAAISLQGHPDTANFIRLFSGSHHFVLDYLVEEILEQQPERIQHFLLSTSILERLCGSLCDAVLPQSSTPGQEILEYLERTNLLLVPLDDKREWYRYHHLLTDALQARLTKGQSDKIAELHLRACAWYEQHNFRAKAIHHALAAQHFEHAADLIELEWSANIGSYYQNAIWTEWVQTLPDELVRTRTMLSLGLAWEFLFSGQLRAAEDHLKDADRFLAVHTSDSLKAAFSHQNEKILRSQQGLLGLAWAFHAQALGDNAATIKHARQTLNLLSETNHYIAGLASSLLGLAYWRNGELATAIQYMSDAIARLRSTGHILFAISGAYTLAGIKIAQGRLLDAVNIYKEALLFAIAQGEPVGTTDLHLGLSQLYHEQGNEEAAQHHLQQCEALGKPAALPEWPYGLYLVQAQLNVEQGELNDALTLLDEAEQIYHRSPVPNVYPVAALKTRVWLRQGRLAAALGWVREQGLSIDDELSYLQEFEYITFARVLIAQYRRDQTEETFQKAIALLTQLYSAAEAGSRSGSMIEILILQAIINEAHNNISSAVQFLERAFTLAETEGYLRIFINEGQPMARLLYEVLARNISPNYVQRVLAAFPLNELEHKKTSKKQSQTAGLLEPLSKREIEVLHLIADGQTNQEIATTLFLSVNTVKVHTRNIYGKLDAHHRADAVAKARVLGVLSST